MRTVLYRDLGKIAFEAAWELQTNHFKALLHSKRSEPEKSALARDLLLICEHEPVYTLGKNGSEGNIIEERGLDIGQVVRTDRGGDITFHGPGQIVGYPIMDLENHQIGLKKYIHRIEQVLIDVLAEFDIQAGRTQGANGVWLDQENPARARKICAIGVKCSRFVTMHGFAFNINTNLDYFNKIIPCGIANKSVTSMRKELGHLVDVDAVKQILLAKFSKVFSVQLLNE